MPPRPPHHLRHLLAPTRQLSTSAAPAKPTSPVAAARAYCLNLLRTHDTASHTLTGLQHPLARDAHIALRAFNIDIAAIDSSTSNVTVGRMRMQFWRNTLESAFAGHPPAEPVAVLLHKVLHEDGAPLSKSFFLKIVAAREQYLGAPPFATLSDLEKYAEATYGSLHYLSLESVHQHSPTLDHIGSHVGKAFGIAAVLRGIPVLASTNAVVLPLDICAEYGLRQEDVLRQYGAAKGLRDAVFRVATMANDHLITARKMYADHVGDEKRGAAFGTFLQAVPTAMFLERLERADFDPFAAGLQKRMWTLPWRAWRAYAKKEF